jgi:hypothetical protein
MKGHYEDDTDAKRLLLTIFCVAAISGLLSAFIY